MKKIVSKIVIASLILVACTGLSSFNVPGGDSFQVYLNGKLVLDKAMYKYKEIQNLELVQASANDKVEICYNHCGRTGTSRSITAKNDHEKILKTWRFADTDRRMVINLQELRNLQAGDKKTNIHLYYLSKELSAGQQLVSVSVENKSVAAR